MSRGSASMIQLSVDRFSFFCPWLVESENMEPVNMKADCTVSFYIRDWSIHGFWYLGRGESKDAGANHQWLSRDKNICWWANWAGVLSAKPEYSNLQHERVDQMTLLISITVCNSWVLLNIYCMLYTVRTIKRREAGGGILEFSAWLQCLLAMWPWARYRTLNLSFFNYNIVMMLVNNNINDNNSMKLSKARSVTWIKLPLILTITLRGQH